MLNSPSFSTVEPNEAQAAAARVAPLLPPSLVSLFDARFTRSHLLFDEYVYRLATEVFVRAGLDAALGEWRSPDLIVAKSGLDPRCSRVPLTWLLRHLAGRGVLEYREGPAGSLFCAEHALPRLDAAPVLAEQRAHDPGCWPSYALAETAARDYPAFLRGERAGDEILLAPARLPLWTSYFSNDHALYAVNNRVGAAALEAWLVPGRNTILELGGGLGSGALAVLEQLAAVGRLGEIHAYRFTEVVPAFLRRAQQLRERFAALPVTFAPLDMNREFAAQGVESQSVSIVYAVNTLHVAHDLAFTLGEVRRVLEPGGQLIVSECIRPRPGQTLYPEFIFNLMETFRAPRLHPEHRPNGGFLTPEQWTKALEAAGFLDVRLFPDIARIRTTVPNFFVAALRASRPA